MHCDPACWGCKAAGVCHKQTPAVSASPTTPHPWRRDPLANKRLGCGHVCGDIPTTLGVLQISKVWCVTCKCWVKPPTSVTTTTRRRSIDDNPDQEVIPF